MSPLRSLADDLRKTARAHICYSQVVELMRVVDEHINAMALIEEMREQQKADVLEASKEYRR